MSVSPPRQTNKFRGLESNQHWRVQSPSSYRLDDPGISNCVGQELNLHSLRRVGYSHLGSPMPSRHISLARVGVEPTASPGLSRGGLPIAYLAVSTLDWDVNP